MHNSKSAEVLDLTYGHFTTFLLSNGGVRGWKLHLSRLQRDSLALFGVEISKLALINSLAENQLIKDILKHQKTLTSLRIKNINIYKEIPENIRVKINISDTNFNLNQLNINPGLNVSIKAIPYKPEKSSSDSLHIQPRAFQRNLANHKHFDLCAALYQRKLAQSAGFDDALFYNPETKLISEGPTWNLGAITHSGKVIFPDKTKFLYGTTMQLITEIADIEYSPMFFDDKNQIRILSFSNLEIEAFFATNAIWGIRPISLSFPENFSAIPKNLANLMLRYNSLPRTSITEIINCA